MNNLNASRLLIATLTDTDKLALLSEQLEGNLSFDSQDAIDALGDVLDAFYASYDRIGDAVDAALVDRADDYDGGRFDFYASRGVSA